MPAQLSPVEFGGWLALSVSIFEAYLERRRVYIPNASGLMELRDKGFGRLEDGELTLAAYEAFYLLEKGRLRVIDKKSGEEPSLRELVRKLSAGKPEVWIKYLVYRDLRDRGYIVREVPVVDFEAHGKGATRRLISIIYEGGEASLRNLERLLKYAMKERKELILAVVDRRTDIVYYSLSALGA